MGNKWLFLRGEHDERTDKSISDIDDMWISLFSELAKDMCDRCDIIFWGINKPPVVNIEYDGNFGSKPLIGFINHIKQLPQNYTHIFSRGGFPWQSEICKKYPDAFKIYYGAGRRRHPQDDISYNLILVDSEKDIINDRCKLWIKPAAKHFKYMPEAKKEYDVAFIANEQQKAFKGIDWVYQTAPKDLKILHLGYHDTLNPPDNITCKRVDRIDMATEINRCKVGIVPYDSVDSCPRVIPEMIACGLDVICLDTVIFWINKYLGDRYQHGECFECGAISLKKDFWQYVKNLIPWDEYIYKAEYYQGNLSLEISSNHIHNLIKECSK